MRNSVSKGSVVKTPGISNPSSPRLLPLKAAAEYLGLTLWALRSAIWDGQIPFIQLGKRKLYLDIRDLESWIDKRKRIIT